MPRISAVIVTRNNRKEIAACLESLAASVQPIDEIIVVDNSSTDGTADFVRREFPSARVLDFWDNPGFGEGNNRGARVASGDYLLLLNPDAMIAPDGAGHLLGAFADTSIGIAAPKVVLAAEPSIINSAGLCVNTVGYGWDRGYLEWDHGQYDTREPVLAASGCALLIDRELFARLGGFDAPYFLYYEDLDLCWRAWMHGRPVHYVPAAVVRHAMKVSGRPALYNEYYDHRNRLRTLLKDLPRPGWTELGGGILGFEAREMMTRLRRRDRTGVRMRWRAWWGNLRCLRELAVRRMAAQGGETLWTHMRPLFAPGVHPRLKAPLPQYREVYDDTVIATDIGATLTMGTHDVGALGLGWHAVEGFDGRAARWCCSYGIAFLAAPAGTAGRATLTVSAAAVHPTTMIVRTDREERGRFALTPGPRRDLNVSVPVHGEVTRVEIVVDPPFIPSEADPSSPDHRMLGVAVDRIGWQIEAR
jgi:GT2 family glycosyltransferase